MHHLQARVLTVGPHKRQSRAYLGRGGRHPSKSQQTLTRGMDPDLSSPVNCFSTGFASVWIFFVASCILRMVICVFYFFLFCFWLRHVCSNVACISLMLIEYVLVHVWIAIYYLLAAMYLDILETASIFFLPFSPLERLYMFFLVPFFNACFLSTRKDADSYTVLVTLTSPQAPYQPLHNRNRREYHKTCP
jgi:hypothetical protein